MLTCNLLYVLAIAGRAEQPATFLHVASTGTMRALFSTSTAFASSGSAGQPASTSLQPASTSAEQPVTVGQVVMGPGYHTARAVSMKAAHKALTAFRDMYRDTQDDEVMHDLTWVWAFDWRAWIAGRSDEANIIGPGIWAFCFVWVEAEDKNLHEKRGDFLVRRIDGTDVRLHPSGSKSKSSGLHEAHPIFGEWSMWTTEVGGRAAQHEALAPTQGPGVWYEGHSPTDAVSRTDAMAFLQSRLDQWYAWEHPRPGFRHDITESRFNWPMYIQNRQWFQAHLSGQAHVERIEVAWSYDLASPVFVLHLPDGVMATVHAGALRVQDELTWGEPLDPTG